MVVADHEYRAGGEETTDRTGPAGEVGQPYDGARARDDETELPADQRGRIARITFYPGEFAAVGPGDPVGMVQRIG